MNNTTLPQFRSVSSVVFLFGKTAVAFAALGIYLTASPTSAEEQQYRATTFTPVWQRPPAPYSAPQAEPLPVRPQSQYSRETTQPRYQAAATAGYVEPRRQGVDRDVRQASAQSDEKPLLPEPAQSDDESEVPFTQIGGERPNNRGTANDGSYDDGLSFDSDATGDCGGECYGQRAYCGGWDFSASESRLWMRADYLNWWTKGDLAPVLATTSVEGTDPGDSGILGRNTTSVLYGGKETTTDGRAGGRFTVGYDLCSCGCWDIEANYLFLGRATSNFAVTSSETPIIARPFYDLTVGAENALPVAHPDYLSGSLQINSFTDFQGAEVLLRHILRQDSCKRLDFVFGYRFLRLDDSLAIRQYSEWTQTQGSIPVGTTRTVQDDFDSSNQFHGGEIGLAYKEHVGRWSLDLLGKTAFGNTYSQVNVNGSTVTTTPSGGSSTYQGGLLAQEGTNIGTHERNSFTVIPEFGATLGFDLTCRLRATVGYSLIYWSDVCRAGNQIDRSLSQLPPDAPSGAERPKVTMQTHDFWAQGINVGLDYRF